MSTEFRTPETAFSNLRGAIEDNVTGRICDWMRAPAVRALTPNQLRIAILGGAWRDPERLEQMRQTLDAVEA